MHRDNQRGVRVNMGRPQGVSVTALVCALCAVCALAVLARWPRWIRGPDEAYVVVAQDAWAGRLSLANYDDETMADRTGGLTAGRNRNFLSPTPPSIAVLLLPLACCQSSRGRSYGCCSTSPHFSRLRYCWPASSHGRCGVRGWR